MPPSSHSHGLGGIKKRHGLGGVETNRSRAVNLRMREDVRALIDHAAKIQGKTRSDFMIDAARHAAEEALLDQALVIVETKSYQHYLEILDQPPSGEGFTRLVNVSTPWQT